MEHTDEKQNGNQQPDVEKIEYCIEYCVDNNLVYEDEIYFYKLITKNEEAKSKFFLIKVDNIVLSPGLCILFSGDISEGSVLDIPKFDEYKYSKLFENNDGNCILKSDNFEILFPVEVDILNKTFSGTVVSNPNFDILNNNKKSFYFRDFDDIYEVKLDNSIDVNSINRIFKNIYIFSKDLLNGYVVNGLKINPLSLFNENNNTDFSKPVLYSYCYDKKDILSKADLWLIKKLNFKRSFTSISFNTIRIIILVVLFFNISSTSSTFAIPWVLSIFTFLIIAIFYFSLAEKVYKIAKFDLKRKNDIDDLLRGSNVYGTLFSFFIIILMLFLFSRHYEYKSEYVYDTKNNVFLEGNSFNVTSDLIFDKKGINTRFLPIYKGKQIDILYQTPGSLLSFSVKYIDLEININFKKGDYLLGSNLDNSLSVIRDSIQRRVSSGYYGDLFSMNTYEYRKSIINIEEDIMNLISLAINEEESVVDVEKIEILTKYAKLQNVDK